MEEKRVEVFIPRGSDREDPNLFVGINGVNYLLPRGKKSKVPAAVARKAVRPIDRMLEISAKLGI